MAILVHARKKGEQTDFRLYDSTDKRYLTPSDSFVGAFDALTALLEETEAPVIQEERSMLRAMVGHAAGAGTSSRRMEPERTLDSEWTNDTGGSWKFERPADGFGRSELMKLHIRVGLLESFRDLVETEWIRRLENEAPESARQIIEETGVLSTLAMERWTWICFPKDGRCPEGNRHSKLGYRNVKGLRLILSNLRAAWKGDVYVEELTNEGPGSAIVRVRFCVLQRALFYWSRVDNRQCFRYIPRPRRQRRSGNMISETHQMMTAIVACMAAGQIHWDYHRTPGTKTKPDGSPVTDADTKAERRMRSIILTKWPNDGFLGEESGLTPGTSNCQWVVDPLDGTIQYVAGMDDYGTLIARTDGQGIELGIVMQTATRTYWAAERGRGAWKGIAYQSDFPDKREPLRVDARSIPTGIENAIVCFGHLSRMDGAGMDIGMLASKFRTHLPVPRFRMFTLVAEGKLDVVIARLERDWDLLANQIVVEEAGGTVILLPLKHGRWVVAARSKGLAEQTVAAINESIY